MAKKKKTTKVKTIRRAYCVYVIKLDDAVLESRRFRNKNPKHESGKDCLYVGQTSKTPEERFEVHKGGGRLANTFVEKHGKYLRKRLYQRYNPIMTQEVALLVEEWLAKKLQDQGFAVWWN